MTGANSESFWGEIAPCEHLLQLYEDDGVLLDSLQGFVAGGLASGECAVVIATPDHLDQLEKRLEASGTDLVTALSADQYIPLDAERTLARFIVGGWPDEELFAETIAEIVARASAGGRRVRAFGEMVALLWAQGHAGATVRLEHLWNKLCAEKRFSLFCAYPRAGVTQDSAHSMSEICAAHSRVVAQN